MEMEKILLLSLTAMPKQKSLLTPVSMNKKISPKLFESKSYSAYNLEKESAHSLFPTSGETGA